MKEYLEYVEFSAGINYLWDLNKNNRICNKYPVKIKDFI